MEGRSSRGGDIPGRNLGEANIRNAFSKADRKSCPRRFHDPIGMGTFSESCLRAASPSDGDELRLLLKNTPTAIPRGNGRSYGDSALNRDATIDMRPFSRMISFDPGTGFWSGRLACCWQMRWRPSSRWAGSRHDSGNKVRESLAGMVASDVHGKNHHCAGGISRHIKWLDMLLPDGQAVRCSRDKEPSLYWATCGGMGLKVSSSRVALNQLDRDRLHSPYDNCRTQPRRGDRRVQIQPRSDLFGCVDRLPCQRAAHRPQSRISRRAYEER